MMRTLLVSACVAGALGVTLGAFGAHGLAARVTPERLDTFETGVRYHMYHTLALLAVAWIGMQSPTWQAGAAGVCFLAGIVVFSGSLYLLVLTDTPWLGAITPLGGLCFIAGWVLLAWAVPTGTSR